MAREGKWERAARLRDEALADMVAKASRDDLAAALLMLDPDEALYVLTCATAHSRVNDNAPRAVGPPSVDLFGRKVGDPRFGTLPDD